MTPLPAALAGDPLLWFLLQIGLLLTLAVLMGRLANRCGMPAIVGELSTGLLLGPSLLGNVAPAVAGRLLPGTAESAHLLDAVGQLGVLLLVGLAATHVDFGMIRQRRAAAVRVSLGGLLVPFGLGMAMGYALPGRLLPAGVDRPLFALFLSVAMCVSAIPVIAKTLTDMRLLHRDIAQLALMASTLDDAAGWFMLSIVAALATSVLTAGAVLESLLVLTGFVLVAAVVVRPLLGGLIRRVQARDDERLTVPVTVVVIIAGAAASHALHLEPVFGAFVAGALVGITGGATGLGALRTVVHSVLAPLFLATAGLRVDLTSLAGGQWIAVASAALLVAVAGKFVGAYLGARLSRLSSWEGLALGAAMNSRGVVEIVIATVGLRLGVIDVRFYTIVVLIAVATSVMAPPLLRIFMRQIDESREEQERAVLQRA